jgi:hypothetical protein
VLTLIKGRADWRCEATWVAGSFPSRKNLYPEDESLISQGLENVRGAGTSPEELDLQLSFFCMRKKAVQQNKTSTI